MCNKLFNILIFINTKTSTGSLVKTVKQRIGPVHCALTIAKLHGLVTGQQTGRNLPEVHTQRRSATAVSLC